MKGNTILQFDFDPQLYKKYFITYKTPLKIISKYIFNEVGKIKIASKLSFINKFQKRI